LLTQKVKREPTRFIYLIYVHRKNIGYIGYYLYIVVDTERILESMGIFIYCCWHKKELLNYGYYLLIVVDTESKRNLPGLFIKFMYTKKNY